MSAMEAEEAATAAAAAAAMEAAAAAARNVALCHLGQRREVGVKCLLGRIGLEGQLHEKAERGAGGTVVEARARWGAFESGGEFGRTTSSMFVSDCCCR